MSWIPTFRIGFWNAWILLLYYPLHPLFLILVDKAIGTGEIFKKMGGASSEQEQKRAYLIYMVILITMLIYSVFLPLKPDTMRFYAGLMIFFIGLVIFLTAIINIATIPLGQLCTCGVYRYSRHPLYISILMTFVGVAIACASWLFLLMTVALISIQIYQVMAEEQDCLKTFGDEYREYMKRTPKWIGIPKSR